MGSIQLAVPAWDTALLLEDATALLDSFTSGVQFGDTHTGTWSTLSLRSADGRTDNDQPAPDNTYVNTDAWTASTYIVPVMLAAFGPLLVRSFGTPCCT